MKILARLALAALALALSLGGAHAQSGCAIFQYGQVPTAGQWNQCLQSKQDVLGYIPLNTAGGVMSGRLTTVPSTTVRSGFAILPGTAPSSPANGDIWVTSAGVFAQINGSTVGPFASASAIPSVIQGDVLYGSAVGVISTLPKSTSATRYLSNTGASNNPAWAPINLGNGVTGNLALSNIVTGTQDTALGYYGSTAVSAATLPNCSTALSYNTSTHAFGCNTSTGSGTVTSVASGTGLTGGPVTTTGTLSVSLPRLEAYLSADQTGVSNATFTLLNFDSVVTDSHSWFNTVTHLYTPVVPGSYLVTAKARCSAGTSVATCAIQIRKNGVGWAQNGTTVPSSTTLADSTVTALVAVNGSDTISAYGFISGTGSESFISGFAPMLTYITVVYLGP